MEACDSALDAKVLVVVQGELLRSELLQTVGILRLHTTKKMSACTLAMTGDWRVKDTEGVRAYLCRPGILLLEATALDLCVQLLVFGIDARAGGVEEPEQPSKVFTRLKDA